MIYIKIFSFQLINAFCLNCTCAISKPYQIHIWVIYGPPPFQKLDFGLGARVFSAVLTHLEPTIPFSYSPAVSHSKSRDFRLYEPTIPFSNWSAVSHSTSGDDVTRPIRSQKQVYLGPIYYSPILPKESSLTRFTHLLSLIFTDLEREYYIPRDFADNGSNLEKRNREILLRQQKVHYSALSLLLERDA